MSKTTIPKSEYEFYKQQKESMELKQEQTQELKEQNAELVDSLSKLVLLLEEIDSTLFHHNHSIDGWHLNGDLEPIMNFVNDMDLEPITEAKELLTKHNHLKSNTNGSI